MAKMTEEDIEGGATVDGKSIWDGEDKTSRRTVVEDNTSGEGQGRGWANSKHFDVVRWIHTSHWFTMNCLSLRVFLCFTCFFTFLFKFKANCSQSVVKM